MLPICLRPASQLVKSPGRQAVTALTSIANILPSVKK
jgi:hypothetical protein